MSEVIEFPKKDVFPDAGFFTCVECDSDMPCLPLVKVDPNKKIYVAHMICSDCGETYGVKHGVIEGVIEDSGEEPANDS